MRRNSFRLFVMFGLILFLGVGYAVVNSVTLTVTGSAGAGSSALNVAFTGDYEISNPNKGITSINNSTSATFNVENMSLGDVVTFTYTVKNNEKDVAADVSISSSGSNEYYSVTAYGGSNFNPWFSIQPGCESVVRISVEMIKTPISSLDSLVDFTVSINAWPIESAGLISFSIDDKLYQAEDGMSFKEWMNSFYNTDNYRSYCVGEDCLVMNADSQLVSKGTSGSLNVDERIISDYSYVSSRSPIPV